MASDIERELAEVNMDRAQYRTERDNARSELRRLRERLTERERFIEELADTVESQSKRCAELQEGLDHSLEAERYARQGLRLFEDRINRAREILQPPAFSDEDVVDAEVHEAENLMAEKCAEPDSEPESMLGVASPTETILAFARMQQAAWQQFIDAHAG